MSESGDGRDHNPYISYQRGYPYWGEAQQDAIHHRFGSLRRRKIFDLKAERRKSSKQMLELGSCVLDNNNGAKMVRILVAEDDAALRAVIAFHLRAVGFEVTVAKNGLAAWAQLQDEHFDAVISDMAMPGIDGTELIKRLRTLPQYAATPVGLITGRAFEMDIEKLTTTLGVQLVMCKPFSPHEMREKVLAMVGDAGSCCSWRADTVKH